MWQLAQRSKELRVRYLWKLSPAIHALAGEPLGTHRTQIPTSPPPTAQLEYNDPPRDSYSSTDQNTPK